MRPSWQVALAVAVVGMIVAGCNGHGGTTSSGVFEVVFTDEQLDTVEGGLCAVQGNATNAGNVRARVEVTYEARNATGAAIGTTTASFEVAPFSKFEFRTSPFSNGLTCSGISSFRRIRTDVSRA